MREIKFRAWVDKKEMIYSDNTYGGYIDFFTKCREHHDGFGNSYLMQFTGLLDKNGKEIYEGDILSYKNFTLPEHKGVWVVTWNAYFWDVVRQFNELYENDKGKGCFEGDNFLWEHCEYMEVIGNIYEHPELLEAK